MSSVSESSPMGPWVTPGPPRCPNCSPRERRNDLAPSPISFQGGGYSFFGTVAKLQKSECDQCAVIASGVLHFARMFRGSGDARPDNISVECDSLQKPSDLYWEARPASRFPDEVGISFRFIDMPERCKIQLQVVASSNALNPSHELRAQTEESLTVIEDWVEKCLKSHGNRCADKGAENVPSRLLEINQNEVRLVQTENLKAHHWSRRRPPKALHYIALSHCWGCEATNTRTVASNIASMLNGIPVITLPKTFRDAIVITLRLGYHLLWIDSLCIIQDDEDDWQRESARMADIYENAVLTIAATRSSDGHGGCFSTVYESPYIWRRIRRFQPIGSNDDTEQPVLVHHPDLWRPFEEKREKFARWFVLRPGHDIRDLSHKGNYGENATDVVTVGYPLLSRAWFFQERLLSSRVVHFGYTELSWECCSAFWSKSFGAEFRHENDGQRKSQNERYPIEKTRRMFISLITGTSSNQSSRSNQHGITNALDTWNYLVEDYTRLKLTREMDRLPALSGIAVSASKVISSEHNPQSPHTITYVAGIWSTHLPTALFWTCSSTSYRPRCYRAPTFSWASVEGAISYHSPLIRSRGAYDSYWVCEIQGFSSTAKGLDPHGEVSSGWIEVRGWTGMAVIAHYHSPERSGATMCVMEQADMLPDVQVRHVRRQKFQLDIPTLCAAKPAEVEPGDGVLILLLECLKSVHPNQSWPLYNVMALVLQPSKSISDAWERVGLICDEGYNIIRQDRDMFYWPAAWFPEKKVVRIM